MPPKAMQPLRIGSARVTVASAAAQPSDVRESCEYDFTTIDASNRIDGVSNDMRLILGLDDGRRECERESWQGGCTHGESSKSVARR